MTTSLPAIQQQSPKAQGKHGRSGSRTENDALSFGKLLKPTGSGPRSQAPASQRAEAGKDARTTKFALDLDFVKDNLAAPKGVAEVPIAQALAEADEALSEIAEAPPEAIETLPETAKTLPETAEVERSAIGDGHEDPDATEAERPAIDDGPIDDGQDDPDALDGAEALLPLLAIVEFRNPKDPSMQNPEPSPGATDNAAASRAVKELPPIPIEDETVADRQQGRLVSIIEQSDPAMPARRAETAFGKTLIANLSALATQVPDRPAQGGSIQKTLTNGSDSPEPLPPAGDGTARRDRNAIVPEAVTRGREPSETGDRHAETRPAFADQKGIAAPSMQAPLSTGTPVVQALAVNPAASATLRRAAEAEAANRLGPTHVQTLKIQLHPAELGKVTANLRMAGEQLKIDIEVETPEAYRKLSSETEAIVRALRAHGIAVDEVVIQAPQVQPGTSARDATGNFADTSSDAGRNFSGSAEFGQPGGSGHANRNAGQDNGHDVERVSPAEPHSASSDSGRGVYI